MELLRPGRSSTQKSNARNARRKTISKPLIGVRGKYFHEVYATTTNETTIAAMIGHRRHTVTSRYVHAADAVLLAAADAVADETARRMGDAPNTGQAVVMRVPGVVDAA